jgi:hypothetical protein
LDRQHDITINSGGTVLKAMKQLEKRRLLADVSAKYNNLVRAGKILD